MNKKSASFLPVEFINRLKIILPSADPQVVFAPKETQSFRVNTLKMTVKDCMQWLNQENISFQQWSVYPDALIVGIQDAEFIKKSDFVKNGAIYPQSMQSMLPVVVLNPQTNDEILDLCSAPGSKTSQIGAYTKGEARITANESVRSRFYKLKSVLELTGVKASLTMVDGRRFQAKNGLFDKILVDAPCSSEGRFRLDDPKSVGFWSVRKIHEMAHKQKGLLMNASRLLKPAGVLVYSTCTFAPEENEAVIDWILRKDPTMDLVNIEFPQVPSYPAISSWMDRDFNPKVKRCLRILPDAKLEGFFIAKLVKSHYK